MPRRKKKRGGARHPEFTGGDPLLDAEPDAHLDLHGDDALSGERRVRDFVQTHARVSRGSVVHIITGRGRGSGGRPVLRGRVKTMLAGELERFVQDYQMDLDEGGWLVRLK